ncbi:DUF748 domain-containing protein [Pseudomonadota bacterium]
MSQAADSSVKPAKPLWKRGWFRWLFSTLLLFILFISLLPFAVQYGALHVIKKQGIAQADIKNIDINLFTGEVGIYGVTLSGDDQGHAQLESLYINLAMQALVEKQIKLQSIKLNGFELDVKNSDQGEWIIAGYTPPPSDSAEPKTEETTTDSSWGIAIDALQLSAIKTRLDIPQLKTTLSINDLTLNNLASWNPQSPSPLNALLHVDGSAVTLNSQLQPFLDEPQFKVSINIDALPLAYANGFLADSDIKDLSGTLNVKTDLVATIKAQQPVIEANTTLQINDIRLQQAQYKIAAKQLNWQSSASYVAPVSETDMGVRVSAQLDLNQFNLYDQKTSLTLANFKQLDIKNIRLAEAQQTSVEAVLLKQLHLLSKQNNDELLTIASTQVNDINYDGDKAIAVESVAIQALKANVILKENGQLHLLDLLTEHQQSRQRLRNRLKRQKPKTRLLMKSSPVRMKKIHGWYR